MLGNIALLTECENTFEIFELEIAQAPSCNMYGGNISAFAARVANIHIYSERCVQNALMIIFNDMTRRASKLGAFVIEFVVKAGVHHHLANGSVYHYVQHILGALLHVDANMLVMAGALPLLREVDQALKDTISREAHVLRYFARQGSLEAVTTLTYVIGLDMAESVRRAFTPPYPGDSSTVEVLMEGLTTGAPRRTLALYALRNIGNFLSPLRTVKSTTTPNASLCTLFDDGMKNGDFKISVNGVVLLFHKCMFLLNQEVDRAVKSRVRFNTNRDVDFEITGDSYVAHFIQPTILAEVIDFSVTRRFKYDERLDISEHVSGILNLMNYLTMFETAKTYVEHIQNEPIIKSIQWFTWISILNSMNLSEVETGADFQIALRMALEDLIVDQFFTLITQANYTCEFDSVNKISELTLWKSLSDILARYLERNPDFTALGVL